jgi:hypothetical protein
MVTMSAPVEALVISFGTGAQRFSTCGYPPPKKDLPCEGTGFVPVRELPRLNFVGNGGLAKHIMIYFLDLLT